jgi:hypothetical protein
MRLLLAFAGLSLFAQDPRVIVEKGLQRAQQDDLRAQQYAYLETSAQQEWKDGKPGKRESETHEIINLYGQPYRRLVAKDGKPLSPEESRKEQVKIDKLAAERARETPEERERRLAKYTHDRRRERAFLEEIPRAYSFKMAGETRIAGRDVWIIEATPLPGYKPQNSRAKLLTKFKGRFYASKEDFTVLKLEAEAIDTVSFGLVLARLDRGARFTMEKTRVNNELWMPVQIKVDFEARLALLKRMRIDVQIDYSDFRKFQSNSRILAVEPLEN